MTLVNRLTGFALGGLAAVLAGFSGTLFGLAWVHLHRQADDRAAAAVDALVAAVEVHPADVEWEPTERRISLGQTDGWDQVRWAVHDAGGRLVDCSENLIGPGPAADGGPWSVTAHAVRAGRFIPEPIDVGRADTLAAAVAGLGLDPVGTEPPRNPIHQSPAFTLTVAVSRRPVVLALWQIGGALATVSVGVGAVAALAARRVCRRALRPVAVMAGSARPLGDDPAARLTVPPTGDELEDLGRAFNDLLGRLHAAHDRQRRFAGDAAHQLRTPLAALLGQVEVALRHDRPADEYRRVLDVVGRRGGHLRQIVESLLFLARADARPRLSLEPLDLSGWLRDRRADWADHPRAADLAFDGAESGPCPAQAHAGLLGQVLDTLLDNALKYSPPGTPVRIGLDSIPGAVRLTVEDRGCGIAPEDVPHLGEPFYRAAEVRRRGVPGVGLGLAVARRAAAAQGGELTVESTPGRGSRFTVALPAAAAPALFPPPLGGREQSQESEPLTGAIR